MKSRPPKRKRQRVKPVQVTAAQEGCLIAAIGASAGGLEALTELVRNLTPDAGLALVVIQHLDPKHHSILTELISKATKIPVEEVTDGKAVEPNHVYVIPPNATLTLYKDTLQLGPREPSPGLQMPIDLFMRSLAENNGNRAIGVILSGSGTDGTLGLAEIHAHGGVTFAQDNVSAKYDAMPRSAVAAGCVDYVLPPKAIARELARIARHPYVARASGAETADLAGARNPRLHTIFQLLHRATGLDFTHYRQTTILRRIQRRMVVHKIDRLQDYIRYIQTNPPELNALYQDMLINVTSFFRNPLVFEALNTQVFPGILKACAAGSTIRVWTPGCASGEETYSVAIALIEFLGDKASQVPIQLFGTDVSESNVEKARKGAYPENIRGDVSPERLRRFFSNVDGGYRISKHIRDMCIFAQHNLINDPPFSRMDLICCRNLLIYLEPHLQSKVVSLFHYAVRPGGFLVLGTSEGIGAAANLFSLADRTHKIYSKRVSPARQSVSFAMRKEGPQIARGAPHRPARTSDAGLSDGDALKEFDRRLLAQFAPATAFVNEDLDLIHTRGNVNRYLKLSPGRASLNIVKMAREGLALDLQNALSRARKERVAVRKVNIQVKAGNGDGEAGEDSTRLVNLDAVPFRIESLNELYFMIIFRDAPAEAHKSARRASEPTAKSKAAWRRIATLEQELAATKEYLQSVIETQEAMNEELQSANEEILSSNEELQSTNEELETAKEELQSTNEELNTVNDELRNRHLELTQVNNDLLNLLSSINVAVIMVGKDFTIRRFTPHAQQILGLIPGDVGRPIVNINPAIEIPDFQTMVVQVMSTSVPLERELTDRTGTRYLLRILPYRTAENEMDGAVVALFPVFRQAAGATA